MFFFFCLSRTQRFYLNNSNQVLGAICIFANSLMRNDLCFYKNQSFLEDTNKRDSMFSEMQFGVLCG